MLRAQVGDRNAFARLHATFGARLRYWLGRMVRDPDVVEDLLQETWLRVVRRIGSLEDPTAFRAWLYRIAHNLVHKGMRGRAVDQRTDRELDVDALPTRHASEEIEEFGRFDPADVHRALIGLGEAQRVVLVLRFLEECSYQEIATIIDRSVGTVRSRIHYGKVALREQLERLGLDAPTNDRRRAVEGVDHES